MSRSWLVAVLVLPLAAWATPSFAAPFCAPGDGWEEVFRDDFNTLNTSNWDVAQGFGYDSLGRQANLTADNVYIEDGALVLRSQRVNATAWTSGAVLSQNKRFFSRARVCVTAQLPGDCGSSGCADGVWPAHWLMPNEKACWPDQGEIDIMEMINGDGNTHATYHYSKQYPATNCTGNKGNVGISKDMPLPAGWGSTWHEFSVEYGTGHMVFAVDNTPINTIEPSAKITWLPDAVEPFYIMLNTAIGGPWPRPPSAATQFPVYHRIDSVVVMQQK